MDGHKTKKKAQDADKFLVHLLYSCCAGNETRFIGHRVAGTGSQQGVKNVMWTRERKTERNKERKKQTKKERQKDRIE